MTQDKHNRDIDALVSSVRDLVRQSPRNTDAATPVTPQSPAPEAPRDVFVLTAQMRVDQPAADIAPAQAQPAADALMLGAAQAAAPAMPLNVAAAQLEAAITADPDDWEIDGGEAFAKDAWAASAFTRHPDNRYNAAPAALDDAALRAVITQILREELTGQTGEKITSNLRKLVRREIARVMAPQIADQGK